VTNTVAIVGNLVRDPEPAGSEGTITKLRVAVNTRRKQGEEWIEEPNYFNVTTFGRLAESCGEYLAKGRQVAVEGRLHWHAWETDGVKREAVEIIANNIQFLGSPKGEGTATPEEGQDGGVPPSLPSAPSEPHPMDPPEGGEEPPGFD
jgi:single-strand DNA-binding protein